MYMQTLSKDGHTRRFSVARRTDQKQGWEIREEEDDRLIAVAVYDDWHRVERAKKTFALEALTLRNCGWT